MNSKIVVRAKRILGRMESFKLSEDLDFDIGEHMLIPNDEHFVGVYMNAIEDLSDAIVVTDAALRVSCNNRITYIPFGEVGKVRGPKDKVTDDRIYITMRNDDEIEISVKGRRGKLKDVFEFLRFIDRAVFTDMT